MFYRARLTSDQFNPGTETIEARLFSEEEIPWDEIAFRTVKETLEHYFADRRSGHYGIHTHRHRVSTAMPPSYVVLDLETTGGNATQDRITEIAAVRIDNGVETARWSTLVNPGVRIPPFHPER